MQEDLAQLPAPLRTALASIAAAVVDISFLLKDVAGGYTGGKNDFGDQQLEADVQCDEIIFRHLRDSRVVAMACSEERPEPALLGGSG